MLANEFWSTANASPFEFRMAHRDTSAPILEGAGVGETRLDHNDARLVDVAVMRQPFATSVASVTNVDSCETFRKVSSSAERSRNDHTPFPVYKTPAKMIEPAASVTVD